MINQCPLFAIGKTQATLKRLPWYNLPDPIDHQYFKASVVKKCGDSRLKSYGYPMAMWKWSVMDQAQLYSLLSLFDHVTDTSVDIYLTTHTDIGYQSDTISALAIMGWPMDGDGKTVVPTTQRVYSDITVKFWHIVEI